MNALDQVRILAQLAKAALTMWRRDTAYPSPVPRNRKFMTARQAAQLVRDGDVVAAAGLGGHQRASILYWALRQRFEASGHPRGLTVINLGGHGGRGILPGTMEELGQKGLCARLITGHFETFRAMLHLAAAGECELQCIPQGTLALLLDGLGKGRTSLVTGTGAGTFVDPRVGAGSIIARSSRRQLVRVQGDRLRYRIPKIDVAIFNAPAADRRGNLYVHGAAMIGEIKELARAARRNRGKVIANVGRIVDESRSEIYLPADALDAVVYHPDTEQTGGIPHRDAWPVFTPDSDISMDEGLARVRFINRLAGLGHGSGADAAATSAAATTLLRHTRRGARVAIGVGLPEGIPPLMLADGQLDRFQFVVESGSIGGLPAPGAYFGASFCPETIVSPSEVFRLCYERLDAACLGLLQVDSAGNVNASRRGDGALHYVGPGGSIDLAAAAQTVIFVSTWMVGGKITAEGGRLRIEERGKPKFVERVDEVTFNGARALAAGKRVFYVTHAGVFRLTRRGVELQAVMPGIDVRRDIVDFIPMKVRIPAHVPRVTL